MTVFRGDYDKHLKQENEKLKQENKKLKEVVKKLQENKGAEK